MSNENAIWALQDKLAKLEAHCRGQDKDIEDLTSRVRALEAAAGVQPVLVGNPKPMKDDVPF